MKWFLSFFVTCLFCVSLASAQENNPTSLEPPGSPESALSAMPTLTDIFELLDEGIQYTVDRQVFIEPTTGPTPSGHSLRQIYENAPQPNDNYAKPSDVVPGKAFWGLGPGGYWGELTGSPVSERTPAPVLKTGQTTSSDTGWNGGDYKDDAHWAENGIGLESTNKNGERFEVNIDNVDTVFDKKTGLMWTRSPCLNGTSYTWSDAFNEVKKMNQSTALGYGFTDWRLPNIKELQSLSDYGNTSPALPEKYEDAFISSDVKNYYYWSSTTNLNNPYASAWTVYMATGMVNTQNKNNPCYVWPVRGGTE